MANVSTIDPSGASRGTPTGVGQRFTTLAAWQTFAAAQATADQWAECYGGGDLGTLTLSSWASAPTPSLYPRVYAHSSARHNGSLASFPPVAAAYCAFSTGVQRLSFSIPYVEIDGLVMYKTATGNCMTAAVGGVKYTLRNNLLARTGGSAGACFSDTNTSNASPGTAYFYNNIMYAAPATSYGGVPCCILSDNGEVDTIYVLNNTVITNGKYLEGFQLNFINAASLISNNVVTGIDTPGGQVSFFDVNDTGSGEHSATYSYNATEDGKSTAYGDPHEQLLTVTPFASATSPAPATGSVLINTGTSTAAYGVITDAIGTARPQGAAYDIGAIEYIPAATGGGRRRRHTTELYL